MTTKINDAIESLVAALRAESPENMTTFRLFVNSEELRIETSERTPKQLKAGGVSMRNLRVNFIAAPKICHTVDCECGECHL
jgi:anion-transporting  ArsA/GET3 family ATPase